MSRQWVGFGVVAALLACLVSTAVVLVGGIAASYDLLHDGIPARESFQVSFSYLRSDDFTAVNDELYSILADSLSPVVVAAEYYEASSGSPILAVFDNRVPLTPLLPGASHWFSLDQMTSSQTTLIVREGSYLLTDPYLGGEARVLPAGEVIGTFPAATEIYAEVLAPISAFRSVALPDTIYLLADAAVLNQVVELLGLYGEVAVNAAPSFASYLMNQFVIPPTLVSIAIGLVITGVVAVDATAHNRPRWRIKRLLGATGLRAGLEAVRAVALVAGVGAALGVLVSQLGLHSAMAALGFQWKLVAVLAPLLLPTLVVSVVAFIATVSSRLHYREWAA
ncbi:MAG: hypothetical protein FWG47_04000 [Propionibacteriaceae bacterium]|nr:hypothetical protein [Propionibacteriaceae bacterium]